MFFRNPQRRYSGYKKLAEGFVSRALGPSHCSIEVPSIYFRRSVDVASSHCKCIPLSLGLADRGPISVLGRIPCMFVSPHLENPPISLPLQVPGYNRCGNVRFLVFFIYVRLNSTVWPVCISMCVYFEQQACNMNMAESTLETPCKCWTM